MAASVGTSGAVLRQGEYTAQGSVNSNQLHLELQSKQNHFALNGTGRPLREENTQ